jgi:predicted membrane-bound dolichyl-phosphate-mannose-protein mannosyltransferase
MKRRFAVSLGGVIALLLGALLLFSFSERVPSHQGKDVYQWMLEQNSSALESNPGLMAIGSNAVPFWRALCARKQRCLTDTNGPTRDGSKSWRRKGN